MGIGTYIILFFTILFSSAILIVYTFKDSGIFEPEDIINCKEEIFCLSGLIVLRYTANLITLFGILPWAFTVSGFDISKDAGGIILEKYST
jgi:hypothetical protein